MCYIRIFNSINFGVSIIYLSIHPSIHPSVLLHSSSLGTKWINLSEIYAFVSII